MTARQRITAVVIAGLIAVAAAIVLGSRGSDGGAAQAPRTAATPEPTVSAATPPPGATPAPRARPSGPLLTAGTKRTLEVTVGDRVSFRIRHDTDEQVHVHGYDISEPLPAGKTVPVSFEATIPGIFEIELESSHVLLARLEVRP